MEIGVSTASLFLRMYNEDAVVTLDKLGARVAEVFLNTFSEYTKEYGQKLNELKGDLDIHSVHVVVTQYEPQLLAENPRAYKDALGYFESVLACAAAMGAKNYTFHGKAYYKRLDRIENYDLTVERLNAICDLAEKYGVEVCLENVFWCTYNRVGVFSHLKNDCKKLRCCLDLKQARLSGCDVFDYLDEMEGRLNTVHLSDFNASTGKMCLPGKGDFDFYKLFSRLKQANFSGNMLIEVYKDDYGDLSEIRSSLEYLRKLKDEIF